MALITQTVIVNAARAVNGMDLAGRTRLADEVFANQPTLLGSILVLHRMGTSMQQLDVPLHVLLVAYQAMKTCGHPWPTITEEIQGDCLQRLTARVRFTEGLAPELIEQAMREYVDSHRERYLLAFAYGHLKDHDLISARTEAEKFLLLATLNLVECIAWAAAQIRLDPSRPTPPSAAYIPKA